MDVGTSPPPQLPPQSTDLVPYFNDARQIVLRHNNTVVVYDDRSKQLSTSQIQGPDLEKCPFCHRPFDIVPDHEEDDAARDGAAFVSPQYFRRLAASRGPSQPTSRPPTPPRRLVQSTSQAPSPSPRPKSKSARQSSSPPTGSTHISSTAFNQGYFSQFFVEERELGRGGRGVVLLVKHVLDGVHLGRFACKRVPVGNDHAWLANVLLEVSLLQNISHKNLVSYRHCWIEDFKPSAFGPTTPHVFILQQYCNAGTLLDYVLGSRRSNEIAREQLKDRARRFSRNDSTGRPNLRSARRLGLDDIFSFFKDITSGLAHLHANGYVHRDLKPQNCLLHRSENSLRVLVSDFGEMQGLDVERKATATGYTGTISFAAPEVVRRDDSGVLGNFTDKSDIFSLGMIVYFLCFGRLPYDHADLDEEHEDLEELKEEVLAWTGLQDEHRERTDLPEKLYRFLQLLLSGDPAERPTTEEILRAIRGGASFSDPSSPSQPSEHFTGLETNPDEARPGPIDTGNGMRQRFSKPFRPGIARNKGSSESHRRSLSRQGSKSPSEARDEQGAVGSNTVVPVARRPRSNSPDMRSPPLLLAPPPRRGRMQRLYHSMLQRWAVKTMKIMLFIGKIWTLVSPCAPDAPRPIFLYTLLTVAAIDVANLAQSSLLSTGLAVLHVAVLALAWESNALCQSGMPATTLDHTASERLAG